MSEKSISVLDLGRNRTQVYHLSDNNTKAGFSILMDATEIGDNYYFAAYGDGVVVTDKTFRVKELLSSNQGILNNGIYKIYKLTDTSFICSSNNGVYIYDINKKRAKKLAQPPLTNKKTKPRFAVDG